MGSRERKRQELQRRKQRAAGRSGEPGGGGDSAERANGSEDPYAEIARQPAPSGQGTLRGAAEEGFQERMTKRSEARNAEARAKLEPLADGERPGAVTAGAIVSGIAALVLTISAIVAALGVIEINGEEPKKVTAVSAAIFAAALWWMTWGLWKARYWAVLGLEMLLVLVLVSAALGLVQVATLLQLLSNLVLLAGASTLFYFLIRAMARIQMPQRPG